MPEVSQPDGNRLRRYQFSLRSLLLFVFFFALVMGLLRWLYVTGPVAVRNGYAGLTLRQMLIEHMEHNDGRWPESWDDLEPFFEEAARKESDYCTFATIKSSMYIDFSFDPDEYMEAVRQGSEPSELRVVAPKLGRFGWGDWWPNEAIEGYLTRKANMRFDSPESSEAQPAANNSD